MPKDPQIAEIRTRLDELVEAVEAYRDALKRERADAEQEQPDNGVYIRRTGGVLGYMEQLLDRLDGEARDLVVQAAELSFTKNQAKDPNFV